MGFWKAFAWFAFAWVLIVRRGAGLLVRRKPSKKAQATAESVPPLQQSGPSWRRISTTKGTPGATPRTEAEEQTTAEVEGKAPSRP